MRPHSTENLPRSSFPALAGGLRATSFYTALASYQRHKEWGSKDLPSGCKNMIQDESWKLIFKSVCHFILFFWGVEIRLPTSALLSKSTFLAILNLDEIFSKCGFASLNLWDKLDASFRWTAFGHEWQQLFIWIFIMQINYSLITHSGILHNSLLCYVNNPLWYE